jgi:hypothetical protein
MAMFDSFNFVALNLQPTAEWAKRKCTSDDLPTPSRASMIPDQHHQIKTLKG